MMLLLLLLQLVLLPWNSGTSTRVPSTKWLFLSPEIRLVLTGGLELGLEALFRPAWYESIHLYRFHSRRFLLPIDRVF